MSWFVFCSFEAEKRLSHLFSHLWVSLSVFNLSCVVVCFFVPSRLKSSRFYCSKLGIGLFVLFKLCSGLFLCSLEAKKWRSFCSKPGVCLVFSSCVVVAFLALS